MMKNKIRIAISVLGALVAFSVYAANPASIDYVDAKIAILQAEINQILQGG